MITKLFRVSKFPQLQIPHSIEMHVMGIAMVPISTAATVVAIITDAGGLVLRHFLVLLYFLIIAAENLSNSGCDSSQLLVLWLLTLVHA